MFLVFFFFNDTATTEIYTLSLHDALPIYLSSLAYLRLPMAPPAWGKRREQEAVGTSDRSEEHTSELQSQSNLVCRLLLEKKKKYKRSLSPDFQILTYTPSTIYRLFVLAET